MGGHPVYFYICVQYTGYNEVGRLQVPWWRQKAAEDQLRVTVEAISAETRVRRRQEFGRRDGSEGGPEEEIMDSDE